MNTSIHKQTMLGFGKHLIGTLFAPLLLIFVSVATAQTAIDFPATNSITATKTDVQSTIDSTYLEEWATPFGGLLGEVIYCPNKIKDGPGCGAYVNDVYKNKSSKVKDVTVTMADYCPGNNDVGFASSVFLINPNGELA